jgi:hypothetical protein
MACTWVAPLSVTARADAVRLTTTRSALRPSAQSDPPAGVSAAAAGALDELALAEAGCPALPADTLPHAASPIRAVTAIRLCTPRAAIAGLLSFPWTVRGRARFRPDSTLLLTGG